MTHQLLVSLWRFGPSLGLGCPRRMSWVRPPRFLPTPEVSVFCAVKELLVKGQGWRESGKLHTRTHVPIVKAVPRAGQAAWEEGGKKEE